MTTPTSDESKLGQNVMLGIGFKVIAVTLFLIMAAMVKSTKNIPIGELVFFRAFFAMLPIIVLLAFRGDLGRGLATQHLLSHVLRGLLGVTAMACMFLALLNLPLPDATAISYATPLMIVVLSALVFKEEVRAFRWTAVMVGFVGVLIIIWPNLSLVGGESLEGRRTFGIIVALAGAVMAAGAQATVRKLVQTESSSTIVMYLSITASTLALFTAPFGWIWPDPLQLTLLIGVGVIGGVGQTFLTEAYRNADMSIIAPFEYSSLILSVLIGYFIFAEPPTLHMLVGGAVTISAGIAIILRERHLGLERAAARKASTPHG